MKMSGNVIYVRQNTNQGCNYYWETVQKIRQIYSPEKIKFTARDIKINTGPPEKYMPSIQEVSLCFDF